MKKNSNIKFIITALYAKCDIILVPNKKLTKWLIVDDEPNSEVREQLKLQRLQTSVKLKKFHIIGLHKKGTCEFYMFTNDTYSYWKGDANSTVYERIDWIEPKEISIIELIVSPLVKVYNAYIGFFALDPWVENYDLPRFSKPGSKSTPASKSDPKVIKLTINHRKFKKRHGITVINTKTGDEYISIADFSRHSGKPYFKSYLSIERNELPYIKKANRLNRKRMGGSQRA